MHLPLSTHVRRRTALLCGLAWYLAWQTPAHGASTPVAVASMLPDGPPARIAGTLVSAGDAYYAIAQSGGRACIPALYIPYGLDGPHEAGGAPRYEGCGAILRLSQNGDVTVTHLFAPADGAHPTAMRAGPNGSLLGVTTLGGSHGRGTVFRYTPASNRFDVLQNLSENPDPVYDFEGYDAALDDGATISSDPAYRTISVLENGKAARTLHRFPGGTHLGPLTIDASGRAVFTAKSPSDCEVGVDALARDGTLTTIAAAHPATQAPCDAPGPSDVLPVRIASDGSIVANDERNVYVAAPGKQFAVAFSLATAGGARPSTKLLPDSAILAANGDIDVATTVDGGCGTAGHIRGGAYVTDATFSGDEECLAADKEQTVALVSSSDGLYGAVYSRFASGFTFAHPNGKAVVAKVFADPVDVKTIAFIAALSRDATTGDLSWGGYQDLGLPDLVAHPSGIDFEMRDLSAPNASSVRLQAGEHERRRVGPYRPDHGSLSQSNRRRADAEASHARTLRVRVARRLCAAHREGRRANDR